MFPLIWRVKLILLRRDPAAVEEGRSLSLYERRREPNSEDLIQQNESELLVI